MTLGMAGLCCFLLRADFQGDQARAGAATRATFTSYNNVAKLIKEINSKRPTISGVENLFDDLGRKQAQFRGKVTTARQQLANMQQLLKGTQEKITQLGKKADQAVRDAQPHLALLHQAQLIKDVNAAYDASNKLQADINDVSTMFKTEQSNLDKLQATSTALEGS